MEAVIHGDDLEGAGALPGAPLARQLDRTLVGLGAAVAEEDLVEARVLDEAAGQAGHLRVVVGGAAVDQPPGLERHRLRDDRGGVAEAVDGPALHEVEIGLAVLVPQPGAVPLDHHHRRPVGDLHQCADIGAHVVWSPVAPWAPLLDPAGYGCVWRRSISRSG